MCCVFHLYTAVELQFQSLLDQTEREESVPQAVRHYLSEMAELTELAKERLDQVKVRRTAETVRSYLHIGAFLYRSSHLI